MNIYVSNLSFNVNDDDLRGFFESYGEVSIAKVINDRFIGKSRGFGFVEMESSSDASKAIKALNETEMDGRNIVVNEAKARN